METLELAAYACPVTASRRLIVSFSLEFFFPTTETICPRPECEETVNKTKGTKIKIIFWVREGSDCPGCICALVG